MCNSKTQKQRTPRKPRKPSELFYIWMIFTNYTQSGDVVSINRWKIQMITNIQLISALSAVSPGQWHLATTGPLQKWFSRIVMPHIIRSVLWWRFQSLHSFCLISMFGGYLVVPEGLKDGNRPHWRQIFDIFSTFLGDKKGQTLRPDKKICPHIW